MKKYSILATAEVSFCTVVEAETKEKAIAAALERDMTGLCSGAEMHSSDEAWVSSDGFDCEIWKEDIVDVEEQ